MDAPIGRPVLEIRVALSAEDYAALVDFYCTGLGLEPADRWSAAGGHGLLLEVGSGTIELLDRQYARHLDELEVGQPVSGHIRLAFRVPDIAQALERLLEHGGALVHEPILTPWGDMNARVEAPDGLQVTLFEVRG